ncbi:MAG: hypothetical protein JWL86_4575 [Rhizobium sp.]|nr:hypothetical protein [Rhizobium sp.]
MSSEITFKLTNDEALVIFEVLSRWSQPESSGPPDEIFEHASEKQALHNLLCVLEAELAEPFRDDYDELLKAARSRLPEFLYPF